MQRWRHLRQRSDGSARGIGEKSIHITVVQSGTPHAYDLIGFLSSRTDDDRGDPVGQWDFGGSPVVMHTLEVEDRWLMNEIGLIHKQISSVIFL